ncbi:P27 family phage terminase small subunit [Cupriavidus yeoncheonensis]|nr:P27 family phage terminase small subunit [Cupriavidus yeoncheonensis]
MRQGLKVPAGLSAAERRLWRSIVASLPADFFKAADVGLLTVYVRTASVANAAGDVLNAEGLVVVTPTGRRRAHPAINQWNAAVFTLARVAHKLRLSHASHVRDGACMTVAANPGARRPFDER